MEGTNINQRPETISYYDHESQIARSEHHIKTLVIIWFVTFLALIGTNIGWIVYETSFQDVVMTENKLDGEGVNIIGAGDVSYGDKAEDN